MAFMQPITKWSLIESAFLLSVPMFGWIAETTCGPGSNVWSGWHWLAVTYACYCAAVGFLYRKKLMTKAREALAANPFDKKALKTWEASKLFH